LEHGNVRAIYRALSGWLASRHEQPVPIFQQLAGGHPSGGDDVREIPAVAAKRRGSAAERGIDISHETVRLWWNRFGPMFAAEIRKMRIAHMRRYPQWRWHLDEVFVKVNGKLCYLWRAVDHEGEVLEAVVIARRDKAAALKLLKRIMKKYGQARTVVTHGLCSYSAAMNEIGAPELGTSSRKECGAARCLRREARNQARTVAPNSSAAESVVSLKVTLKGTKPSGGGSSCRTR
jgi:transposase-like protein